MPLYEYQCDVCEHRFERIQKFSDPLVDTCPKCGGVVHKLQSSPAFQFKGSGFYITDYAKKDEGSAKAEDVKAEKAEKAEKADKSEKADKTEKADKSEKAVKSETAATSERADKRDTPTKADKSSSSSDSASSTSTGTTSTPPSSTKSS